jgi:hypothetical protein
MNQDKLRRRKNRKSEKGAAMVTVLLISFLLLVASAGLLMESSMNSANVTDAIAEQQAYNAAESGIQSAINVLRGFVPLTEANRIDTTKPVTDPANRIDYKKAITLSTSNLATDVGTGAVARLSRWLDYKYKPTAITDWRVPMVGSDPTTTYVPSTGYAFTLNLSDPDNASGAISYTTTGIIAKEFTNANNEKLTISYVPPSGGVNNLNVSSGSADTNFGYFKFETNANGNNTITIPRTRFFITVNMTLPYTATKTINGWIEAGTITKSNLGTVKITFDSQLYSIKGSTITLTCPSGTNCNTINTTITNPTLKPPIVGYQVTPFAPISNAGGCQGCTPITAKMTPCEPTRLLLRSTGYGPRGAKKVLEAIIQKNFFDGLQAPATLTLVGASNGFVFNPGSSAAMQYSGDDVASSFFIPPIGTTNSSNLSIVQDSVDGKPPHPFNGTVVGTPSDVTTDMPAWLKSPAALNDAVETLRGIADNSGRVFPAEDGSLPANGNFGDNATAKGITFVNGDVELTGNGGGILVCTGTLTLSGNFNFNGLVIVTGAGGIVRKGGGGGTLQGNVVIAPYNVNDLSAGFLAPKYDLSGGGDSNIIYNSSSVQDGLVGVSNFVLGVAEK